MTTRTARKSQTIHQSQQRTGNKRDANTARQGPVGVDNSSEAALLALLRVEAEAREAASQQELIFLIANEMRKLTRARQVFVLRIKSARKIVVTGINAMDSVDRNSPQVRWIERLVSRLQKTDGLDSLKEFTLPAYCNKNDVETANYPFREMIWLPFRLASGRVFAGVLLSREQVWSPADLVVAKRLGATFAHAWAAITGQRRLRSTGRTRKLLAGAALACIGFSMAIPVPVTALAPAEIVAASPFVIAAPIDGVIRQILVEPNAMVKAGDALVRFDDVSLRNRLEVAEHEVLLARSKLKKNAQAAFSDPQAKRELRSALAEVRLKQAELAYARELLSQTVVRAPRDGIVVFSDKNGWTGRPVTTGQKIMEIADASKVRLKIDMPVDDAIVVAPKARVRVYLDSDPLHPLDAAILRAGHEARPSPRGVMSYELTAVLANAKKPPRLGTRGTAQVYGEKAPLFFYLFRRPLSALRQRFGI